jgi:hypothetical protein
MLKLAFLTEEENAKIEQTRKVYTDYEVTELSIMATALKDLTGIMNIYTCREKNLDVCASVFNIVELLIDPIQAFLYEGAIKETADPGDKRGHR